VIGNRKEREVRFGIDARLVHYRQEGIGQYILNLLRGMAAVQPAEDIVVLHKGARPDLGPEARRFSYYPLLTPSHHRFEQTTMPLELIPAHLDLLHSPDFIAPLRRLWRSVITIHDLAFLIYPHLLTDESKAYYGQVRMGANRADHIITPSESTKRDVIERLNVPPEKVTAIYEAANSTFRPMDAEELRQAVEQMPRLAEKLHRARIEVEKRPDQDVILFVSTIEPRKNLPTLLRAFRSLLDTDDWGLRQPKLVVVGNKGWLYEEVFDLVEELKVGPQTHFFGGVEPGELPALYNLATVFACPSLYEGFGLPPLEAMACGIPVAASNVSSLPEVVGDAGLLIEPLDAAAWAGSLHRLLTDSALRERLSQKGMERAKMFTWEKAAQETLELYRKVAGK
jgi:glycosyltransferase involved in cell wall biosynthesis